MPNLKFSQFQEQTDPANVQFIVGYNGTDNVRIAPGNMIADSQTLSISGNQISISEGNSITLYDQTLSTTDNVEFNDLTIDRIYSDPQGTAGPQIGNSATFYSTTSSAGNSVTSWTEILGNPAVDSQYAYYTGGVTRTKNTNDKLVGYITGTESWSRYEGSGGLKNYTVGAYNNASYRGTDPNGNNGTNNFTIGAMLWSEVKNTSGGTLGYMRAADMTSRHSGGATVTNMQGAHISCEIFGGTARNVDVLLLDYDSNAGETITGDTSYLRIQNDTWSNVSGTSRAINSLSTLPSRFGGLLESTSFVKTGGTSAQFLKADGSVDESTYLTSATLNITSQDITTALGFTPYSDGNPDSFTSLTLGSSSTEAMAGDTVTITPEQATAIENNAMKVSNVQSDWNAVAGSAVILNKPNIPASLAGVTNSDSDTPGGKTALGVGAGNAAETATKNTWVGFNAGNDTTSGDTNVAIGYKASQNITTGFDNVMIGAEAGFTMSVGDANVGVGYRALYSSTVGFIANIYPEGDRRRGAVAGNYTNISLGNGLTLSYIDIPVGYEEEPDDYNYGVITGMTTAIVFEVNIDEDSLGGGGGDLALEIDVRAAGPGRRNTAIGYESLFANNLANENTAVGYESLRNTVEGYDNTAVGTFAMKNNVNGYHNVSLGYQALEGAVGASGNNNVAIGLRSMRDITSGYQNSAMGSAALQRITSGYQNATLGYNSGNSITSGYQNVFIGSNSGNSITSSYQNIGIGANSLAELRTNSDGYQNVGIGDNTFGNLIEGYQNIALGSDAGVAFGEEDGAALRNTLIGTKSMSEIVEGSNNTCLGYNSGNFSGRETVINNSTYLGNNAIASADGVTNEIAIGYNAVGGGSNTIVLGNSSITALKCQVQTITSLSDKRDKTNIQDSEYGLDLISKLKPVTFDWNMRDGAKVGIKDLGFIAQDLQEVNDDYTQLVEDKNPEKLEASYGRLIPVLVKAIQELKAEIELLKS